jgi:hypothetical protein
MKIYRPACNSNNGYKGKNWYDLMKAAIASAKLANLCGLTEDEKIEIVADAVLKASGFCKLDDFWLNLFLSDEDSFFWDNTKLHLAMDEAGYTQHIVKTLNQDKYFGKTQIFDTSIPISEDRHLIYTLTVNLCHESDILDH